MELVREWLARHGDGRKLLSCTLSWPFFASPLCSEAQRAGLRTFRKRFFGLSGLVIFRAGLEHPLPLSMTLAIDKSITHIQWL